MNLENEKNWIENFLLPLIFEQGKLIKTNDNNLLKKENFIIKDIIMKLIGSEESFMLTSCYKCKIVFNYAGKEYSNTLIVKKTPRVPEDAYDAINFDTLFHNEITAYTRILPAFGKCMENYYPKYFYSYRKMNEACIVLGDFNIDGWRMTKNRVNLSLEHILLAVKCLGKFNGLSYALKQNDPIKFNEIISLLKEGRYATEPPSNWALILNISGQRAIKSAKDIYGNRIPKEFYEKLLKLVNNNFAYAKNRLRPIEPFAIICHGDYLRNNIAFKYQLDTKDNKYIDEKPIDVMMFDFQTLRYSSPMVDLCTFMAVSTGKDVREENFKLIFKCYFDELINVFQENTKNNQQLPKFLNYDSMLNEYIQYLPYALGVASSFLMNLYEPEDISPEEFLNDEKTDEEIIEDVNTRGGKTVDIELAALVYNLYEFTSKYNVEIFEGFI